MSSNIEGIVAKCTSLKCEGSITTTRNYHYGRVRSSDGSLSYSIRKKVYIGHANGTTTFALNANEQDATSFSFKVSNAHYVEDESTDIKMTVAGTVTPG